MRRLLTVCEPASTIVTKTLLGSSSLLMIPEGRCASHVMGDDPSLQLLYGIPQLHFHGHAARTISSTPQETAAGSVVADAVYSGSLTPKYTQELVRRQCFLYLRRVSSSNVELGKPSSHEAVPLSLDEAKSIVAALESSGTSALDRRLVGAVDMLVLCTCSTNLTALVERILMLAVQLLRDVHVSNKLPQVVMGRLLSIVVASVAVAPKDSNSMTSNQLHHLVQQLRISTTDTATSLTWLRIAAQGTVDAPLDESSACIAPLLASYELSEGSKSATRYCREQILAFTEKLEVESPTLLTSVSWNYTHVCRLAMVAASYARGAATHALPPHRSFPSLEMLMRFWPMLVAHSLPTTTLTQLCSAVAEGSNMVNPIRAWQILREHSTNASPLAASDDAANMAPGTALAINEVLDDILDLASPAEIQTARSIVDPQRRHGIMSGNQKDTWAEALRTLVEHMHTAEAADVPWRDRAPIVLAELNRGRRYDEAVRLFDEYSSLITAADVWSSVAPTASVQKAQPKLHLKAVEGFARAVAKSSRWYRALDVVSALGFCDPREASPATSMTVWRHTAESLRSRWEPALGLLTLLQTHGASKATRDACAPFILEAVSKMQKEKTTWLNALEQVSGLVGPPTSAQHAEAMLRLTAWVQPQDALRLIMEGSNKKPLHHNNGLRPRQLTMMTAASQQFARHGHWAEAMCLAMQAESVKGQGPLWDTVTAALQHHHLRGDDASDAPHGSSLAACMTACVTHQPTRFVLRGLLRASENHGWLDPLAETMPATAPSLAQQEYGAWAALLRHAQHANWAAVRSMLPLVLTDTYLVRAACSAPWMAIAATFGDDSRGGRYQRRQVAAVKFVWTTETLRSLQVTCGGSLSMFAQRVLQIAPQQVLAKDARESSPAVGKHMFLLPLRTGGNDTGGGEEPSLHGDVADHFQSRMLIVGACSGCVVASKPPGWSHETFCSAVQRQFHHQGLSSLYKIQPLTQGLVVFAPVGSPTVHYHLTMFLLLGLRKIVVDAVPLLKTTAYSKYNARVVHALPEGILVPSSEVVIVEVQCSSNAAHGPAGSFYDLTMDFALEGWGFVGDAANEKDETHMDEELQGGRRSASSLSTETGLEGRSLFLLREIVVVIPDGAQVGGSAPLSTPQTSLDSATSEVVDLATSRTKKLQVDIPIPHWWTELGLIVPVDASTSVSNAEDEFNMDGDVLTGF
ncbi:Hypothetical protein, putative [Bodo saltans]|uniref:Uncharacterized protein n=1 Tax=Bodo saltans TaxID=75058 RepID=A0A0S4KJW2_BODSA|nr:Hypothetical protein, putative [Bodo saltans]|eukprot:CUI12363.1 Hypothetical protein, putative [Bodo saltans]